MLNICLEIQDDLPKNIHRYVHCAQWNIWYLIVHATDMKVEKEAFFSKEIKQRQVRDKLG